MSRQGDFELDKQSVRRSFDRAAPDYDEAAVLQAEVRQRMLGRLDYVKLDPVVALDIGTGTGEGALALRRRYRGSRIVAADLSEAMLGRMRDKSPWWRRPRAVCGDMERLPFADDSLDLVFSCLTLQWCNDLSTVFSEVRRVLKEGGVFLFSTFGPGTLAELAEAWGMADPEGSHVSRFVDMHDVGDALVRAGLAEPVLDVDEFTLTYEDVGGVMRDLKSIGAQNSAAQRPRGLTGKGRFRAMAEAYEARRRDGRLPASYEVVYGQAWGVAGRPQVVEESGEVKVPFSMLSKGLNISRPE